MDKITGYYDCGVRDAIATNCSVCRYRGNDVVGYGDGSGDCRHVDCEDGNPGHIYGDSANDGNGYGEGYGDGTADGDAYGDGYSFGPVEFEKKRRLI